MDTVVLMAAVESGDARTVFDLLRAVPEEVLAGEFGSSALAVAAYAGHHEVVGHLVGAGADPARPWADGSDPVSWAADRGACEVLRALLSRSREPWREDGPEHRALRTAKAWIGVDPEDELRRRLGVTEDDSVVEREEVAGEYGPQAMRIRLTGADGRQALVETAHRAIITQMEVRLGIVSSPEELTDRALFHGHPDYCDWTESLFELARHATDEIFGFAASLVRDPALDRRRFGIDLLHSMSFDDRPFARQAAELLRPLLDVERDAHALQAAIAAYSGYSGYSGYCEHSDELRAFLVHACHGTPDVRGRVAMELGAAATSDHPDVLAALGDLASDPEEEVRTLALRTLADCSADSPGLRTLMAAHLDDDHADTVVEAAAGLALREDDRGERALTRLSSGIDWDSPIGSRIDTVRRALAYRATERARRQSKL